MARKDALVLLSGGLDSAVNLAAAVKDGSAALAVTIRYRQRAEAAECQAAQWLSQHYDIPWINIDLRWLGDYSSSALTAIGDKLPEPNAADLDDLVASRASAAAVWVPNRNGLFINVAAAVAEARGLQRIVVGFNREEAATFPDNSVDFITAVNRSLKYSTANQVRVDSYTAEMDKREIVALGQKLDLPFDHLWSCYTGEAQPCGRCESCQRFQRAMEATP